jgi:hypothetical protein
MKRINLIISIGMILIIIYGCSNKHIVSCTVGIESNSDLINKLIKTIPSNINKKIIIKTIVWNHECSCGLVDIAVNRDLNHNFHPVFVNNDSTILPLYATNTLEILHNKKIDSLFHLLNSSHKCNFWVKQ